jgi:hypothetical protein
MSVESAENKLKAFDWIIRHLKDHDFSEEPLADEVIEAVDELVEEFQQQRDALAGYVQEYNIARGVLLKAPAPK